MKEEAGASSNGDEKLKEAARVWAEKADKLEETAKEQVTDAAASLAGTADKLADTAKVYAADAATALAGTADKLADTAKVYAADAATALAGLADKLMDKLTGKDQEAQTQEQAAQAAEAAAARPVAATDNPEVEPETIDFSNVEIEPLFEDEVDFDTFSKSDFRAVKVKDCVAVPKSKKLLQFTLDDGTGTDRIILSGIHAFYEPEQLLGKTLVAITNLPPRKMMGIESCGMLLSAIHNVNGEEKLNLLMVDDSIPAGAKLY